MIDFYWSKGSPRSQAAKLTVRALGIQVNYKEIKMFERQPVNLKFLAINPEHCVPTIVDGEFKLWESRVISTYLVSQYAEEDSLYPAVPKKKALVDRLMFFDSAVLNARLTDYIRPTLHRGEPKPDESVLNRLIEALKWLEVYINGHKYAAGDDITVADHTLATTVSLIKELELVDLSDYPTLESWFERCYNNITGFEIENEKCVKVYAAYAKPKLNNQ